MGSLLLPPVAAWPQRSLAPSSRCLRCASAAPSPSVELGVCTAEIPKRAWPPRTLSCSAPPPAYHVRWSALSTSSSCHSSFLTLSGRVMFIQILGERSRSSESKGVIQTQVNLARVWAVRAVGSPLRCSVLLLRLSSWRASLWTGLTAGATGTPWCPLRAASLMGSGDSGWLHAAFSVSPPESGPAIGPGVTGFCTASPRSDLPPSSSAPQTSLARPPATLLSCWLGFSVASASVLVKPSEQTPQALATCSLLGV